jgi:hypothetical protein
LAPGGVESYLIVFSWTIAPTKKKNMKIFVCNGYANCCDNYEETKEVVRDYEEALADGLREVEEETLSRKINAAENAVDSMGLSLMILL